MRSQVGKFTLVGDGLCVGYDSGDPVSEQYKSPGDLKGGSVHFVTVSVDKKQYLDAEKEAALKLRD
jgi:arylsulfatase